MLHSAEIRWFIKGDLPDEVREWFTADGLAVEEEPRVDEYLVLPGCTTTGVKFRQYPGENRASFEIKARTSDPVPVSFGESIEGMLDTWVKWTCKPADAASFRDSITAGQETWVFVEKRRSLRKFSMESGEPLEVDPATRPDEGCQVELTEIRTATGPDADRAGWDAAGLWWSLSLESFGRALTDNLMKTARICLSGTDNVKLPVPGSDAYPGWLRRFVD